MSLNGNLIWVVVGTRPEVIKQYPVYKYLKENFPNSRPLFVGSGQHTSLLIQTLAPFQAKLDLCFELNKRSGGLGQMMAQLIECFSQEIAKERPDAIIVQGDTATSAAASIAGFLEKIPVYHNEAGLRSYDLNQPFPEEANRKWISVVARHHFAPTELARKALLKEGVQPETVSVIGNTGLDSLVWAKAQTSTSATNDLLEKARGKKLILTTIHRRENEGLSTDSFYSTLRSWAVENPDYFLICPLHPNNLAKPFAEKELSKLENCFLTKPMDYLTTCQILSQLDFCVTDSGGLQEECVFLGVPVVVYRNRTEREEGVQAGRAMLGGPDIPDGLIKGLQWAMSMRESVWFKKGSDVFGDGRSSRKIAGWLVENGVLA